MCVDQKRGCPNRVGQLPRKDKRENYHRGPPQGIEDCWPALTAVMFRVLTQAFYMTTLLTLGGERRRWKEEGRLVVRWVSKVVTHA